MMTLLLMHTFIASAQQNAVFAKGTILASIPFDVIDSIKPNKQHRFDVYLQKGELDIAADSILFNRYISDTIIVDYKDNQVSISNPRLDFYQVGVEDADVTVKSLCKRPFVCHATGSSKDGRLIIDADTTCTLVLDNLQLTSQKGSTICLINKHKAIIKLPKETNNVLMDPQTYKVDSTETANGCLYNKGSLVFTGSGTLSVTGNNHHGIASGKNITIEKGHLIVNNAVKDGIHCDKFSMEGGEIELNLSTDASKGIKCKEEFFMKGGGISGKATGNVIIKSGETSYCSLIKSDGTFILEGGELSLQHWGNGGRCISVDGNMTIRGGMMTQECYGDGGSYLNASNTSDYFTPKCITVDDTLQINSGTISCLSTGLGGKGIVAGKFLSIGDEKGEEPILRIETKGECIVNNVDEDLRSGCPKAIKANENLCIYGGDITISTAGMGGEGIESNGTMFVYGGKLECNTFDDGINVANSIEIAGGQVFCYSADNDGIDSNGSITISGGIVVSVNQNKPNESFDSEQGQLFLFGGTIFGIGSGPVDVKESKYPCYSTPYFEDEEGLRSRGLILTEGKYICVQKGDNVLMALRNDNKAFRSFITIMSPSFQENELLTISEGDCPLEAVQTLFGRRLILNGRSCSAHPVTEILVETIKQK